MSIAIARPTLVMDNVSVDVTPWSVDLAGEPPGAGLHAWDRRATLRITRTLTLNTDAACQQLGFSGALPPMDLVVRYGTGFGRLPRELVVLKRQSIESSTTAIHIDEQLSSAPLAGQLWLLCDIVLVGAAGHGSELSPSEPATRLWTESISVPLEQDVHRFPTEIGSFAQLFPTERWCHAPWCLRWYSADPARDLASALRLYLNSDRKAHCERMEALDPVVLEPVLADVMGQVVERAALDEGRDDGDEWPDGSLGDQALRWRDLAFPGLDAAAVREIRTYRPGDYRASFLAAAELAARQA